MSENRFNRNELLFGRQGQKRLRRSRLALMGAGGLGSICAAEAALLGFGHIDVVDREELDDTNRNRYLGAWHTDPVPGSRKADLAVRHIGLIDPSIRAAPIHDDIVSPAGLAAIKAADFVLGCVDNDGVRFFLNEVSLAYSKPLIDMASDAPEGDVFGGRVAVMTGDHGCLHCLGLLDPDEVRRFLSATEMLENEAAIYGIKADALAGAGPSVVTMNGVVASLGMTALMALATDMKVPYTILTHRGDHGTVSRQRPQKPADCYYCSAVRGTGDGAELDRYFRKLAA